jgi:hypothetical protein
LSICRVECYMITTYIDHHVCTLDKQTKWERIYLRTTFPIWKHLLKKLLNREKSKKIPCCCGWVWVWVCDYPQWALVRSKNLLINCLMGRRGRDRMDVAQETAYNYVTLKMIIFNLVNKEVDRVSPDIVYFLFIYLSIYSFNFLWIRDHGRDQEWHVVKLRQASFFLISSDHLSFQSDTKTMIFNKTI